MDRRYLASRICLLVALCRSCLAFNLDQEYAIIKKDSNVGNLFGFSVALHQHNDTDPSTGLETSDVLSWVLVGAPKANNSFLQGNAVTPGTVFKCNALSTVSTCDGQVPFDTRAASRAESKDNQWLGVSIKSAGFNKHVYTCAHRYLYKTNSVNYHLYEGSCRSASQILEKESQFNPCRPYHQDDIDRSRAPSQNTYGHCLAGIGLDIVKESKPRNILLGTVGAVSFTGRVMQMDEENAGARPVESDIKVEGTAWSNIGYSLANEHFFDKQRYDIASGGPRAQSTGQVYMFNRESQSITTKQVLPASEDEVQIGSAFGFAVCGIDTDNDGLSELVVSAPFHENLQSPGDGIVYIYHNKDAAGKFVLKSKLKVKGSRINFGTSVACLGDLNLDGHPDLAVGAPYDDDGAGAIYIYQGSDKGIVEQYTQKIAASSVGSGFVAFGRAISGGADIDSNGYPDIVVGAPGSRTSSGAAVVLRTRPVLRIHARLQFSPSVIDATKKECIVLGRNTTCFYFQVCLKYTEMSNKLTAVEKLRYSLTADPGRSPRVRFKIQDRSTVIDTVDITPTETCHSSEAYLVFNKDGTIAVYPDLEFSLAYELLPPAALSPPGPNQIVSLQKRPVLERDYDATGTQILKTKIKATLQFKRPCSPCIPDLSIALPVNQTVRLGSANYNLNVSLSNLGSDPAYAVGLVLHLPSDVTLSRIQVGTRLPQCGNPVPVNNMSRIICEDLFNEFAGGKTEKFTVVLDTKSVEPLVLQRMLCLNITSANAEVDTYANNVVEVNLNVIAVADISMQGTAVTKREVYGGTIKGESDIVYAEDVGHVVRHNYYVVNEGPDLIPAAEVSIYWPYEAVSGKHLLYLISVTSDAAQCTFESGQPNGLKLKSKSSGKVAGSEPELKALLPASSIRERRDVPGSNATTTDPAPSAGPTTAPVTQETTTTTTTTAPTSTPPDGKAKVEGKLLDCRQNSARCTVIKCTVNNFEKNKGVTFTIKSRIWNATFLMDYHGDTVTIASYATVKVSSNASYVNEIDLTNNAAQAYTILTPAFVAERKGDISAYIIALAVIAGILLLALLIFVLYKIGFFNRNRSTYKTRDKHDKEGADDSLLKGKAQANGDD